jgi:hypothetical protein
MKFAHNAAFHFLGGFVGKSYRKDTPVIIVAAQQQFDVFAGEGVGLSRSG